MPDVTAKNTGKNTQAADAPKHSGVDSPAGHALDACYGQIGISAVAAAARYQGIGKNTAYAPVANNWRAHFVDETA
jgi:hypothetical protein